MDLCWKLFKTRSNEWKPTGLQWWFCPARDWEACRSWLLSAPPQTAAWTHSVLKTENSSCLRLKPVKFVVSIQLLRGPTSFIICRVILPINKLTVLICIKFFIKMYLSAKFLLRVGVEITVKTSNPGSKGTLDCYYIFYYLLSDLLYQKAI